MNWITANLDTNPLRVTLIFSVFLHVTGFYFLSGLTFDSAIRVPETIPITVRPLTEKKEIKPLEVARAPQPTRSKLAQSIHPVSVPQKEKVFPRPTLIHEKRNRIQPNRIIPQAQFPRDLDRVSLTSIENLSSSPTRSQSRSRQAISMAVPRGPQSNHLSQENSSFSVKSTEVLVASTEEILQTDSLQARAASGSKFDTSQTFPPTLAVSERPQDRDTVFTSQARAASNIKIDVPQKFTPARLLANRDGEGNNRFTPTVRTAALASGFTEESLEAPKATDTAKSTPPGFDRFSALEIGKLRQGFRKQIRHKVGKAKYYPKIARRLGFEGKPVVSFTLGFKGELLDLKLVQASTYNLLNEAALETIRRGTPYPPIPGPLGKKSISFDLPILYTLED